MNINLFDNIYPMAFTVFAQQKIAEECGGIENMGELFEEADAVKAESGLIVLGEAMLLGGEYRARTRARILHEKRDNIVPPNREELASLLPDELKAFSDAVRETMSESRGQKIEALEKTGGKKKTAEK
jgi:hypothetical protein